MVFVFVSAQMFDGVLNGFVDLNAFARLDTDLVFCLVTALLLNLVDRVLFLTFVSGAVVASTSFGVSSAVFSPSFFFSSFISSLAADVAS